MNQGKLVLLLVGFVSLVAQLVTIRELLYLFSYSGPSVGVIIFSWLLLVAIGSRLGKLLNTAHMGFIITLLSIILPLLFVLAKTYIFPLFIAETHSLISMLGVSISSLGFPCLFFGAIFILAASRMKTIAHAYLYAGIGALIGGIVYNFFLYPLPPLTSLLVVSGISISCAYAITNHKILPVLLLLTQILILISSRNQ